MSLLYHVGNVARYLARRLTRLYYPDIEVTGRERIPASGAVLFAANHPNSMLDPAVIGIVAKRPVHFFAKATLFDIPVFGALMRALGMVPAFRGVDDKAEVKRNVESLSAGASYLVKGEAVGIFPEGKSHDLPHVEQVKTGVARIVLQAVQADADVKVVPLGLNYEKKTRFRSALWVGVGEPIDAKAWFAARSGDEHKAMRALSGEVDHRLKEIVVHLNKVEWQPFLEDLEVLRPPPPEETRTAKGGQECPRSVSRRATAGLHQRKRIADAMNYFLESDPARAEATAGAIQKHKEHVAAAGLSVQSPILQCSGWRLWKQMLLEAGLFLCGLPFVMAGTVHHLVPFMVTRLTAKCVRVPGEAKLATTRLLIGLPVYGLWYGFVWWALAKWLGFWVGCGWTVLMPFAGIISLHYWYRMREAERMWWQELRMLLQARKLKELRAAQEQLCEMLSGMAEEYAVVKPRS